LLYNTLRWDLPVIWNDIINYNPTDTFSDLEITYDNFTNNPRQKIFYKVKK
jgi:hypothetical protein